MTESSSKQPITLIFGLGNFAKEYQSTRHNVGSWFVQKLAAEHGVTLRLEKKLHSLIGETNIAGNTVKLAIPTTFMNVCGQAIQEVTSFYKIEANTILVAHDELDFPPGTARLKFGGGHGGHNGLRDIISQLSRCDFYRLRFGIGHPGNPDEVSNYVLHAPSLADQELIETKINETLLSVPDLCSGAIDRAMQTINSTTLVEQ